MGLIKEKQSEDIYVKIEQDRIIRKVNNLKEAEVIILVANKNKTLGKSVIDTKILSKTENLLEHRKIKHIIHSGEYTESMAYDVTKLAIDMALLFIKDGIYSYDLLPHNFTFENGNWILYDFGGLKITPEQVKTQIRSIFKISFSAFELGKIINRAKLKHYYLNRIKLYDLIKIIPTKNWLRFRRNLRFTQLLCTIGFYERAYKILKSFYNNYEKEFKPEIYNYQINQKEKSVFNIINNLIQDVGAEDIYCTGEFAGKWAIKSSKKLTKFIYFDDYNLCDKYYNYLKQFKLKNISTAVLYPMMEDNNIPDELRYRALYDYFAQERFLSDIVIIDFDEFDIKNNFDYNKLCSNISKFSEKGIIIKLDKSKNTNELLFELSKYYKKTEIIGNEFCNILFAKDKINNTSKEEKKPYINANRMQFAKEHTKNIIQILKNQKINS